MKNYTACVSFLALCMAAFSGCASSRTQIKATSPNSEIVIAEGMGPVINNDIQGAKSTSLHEALKNALGLVIGVYVSQESLVAKAVLIDDNITSQTEGYIEKYEVLKESRDGDFYVTRIKALVRREDLSAKLKALELEPKKLGNPVVKFTIEETIDGKIAATTVAASELKKKFLGQGYTVSDGDASDILVEGKAESTFNTDQGLGGLVSYRAVLDLRVIKTGSRDVITTATETLGGVDVTRDAAAKKAIANASEKVSRDLPATVLKLLKERSVVQLTISNVDDINKLNDFVRSVRALTEVRDCWTRNFSNGSALLDMDVRKGTALEIAKRLEQMTSAQVKVNKTDAYSIEAELVK